MGEASGLTLPLRDAAGASSHAARTSALVVVTLGVAIFLAAWGTLHYGFYTHRLLLDTPIYEHYGDATLRGEVPYRDFAIEYPPAALPVFVLPSAVAGKGHFGTYTRLFEGLMGLCGVVALVARTRRMPQTALAAIPWPWLVSGLTGPAPTSTLWTIGWYFAEAGAFVFGSGLAIVPFMHGGVVGTFHWLTERQFLDAVAVAMITPGPVVITVAFIGYLVAGPVLGHRELAAVPDDASVLPEGRIGDLPRQRYLELTIKGA